VDDPVTITGSTTIYAIWAQNYYNVTYDLNGASGTAPSGSLVGYGGSIQLPAAAVSRTGYFLAGWGANDSTTITHSASAYAIITGTTTMYAIWAPTTYVITYNLGGGSWVSGYTAPTSYNVTTAVTLPTIANITRSGYTALYWHEGSIIGPVVSIIPANSTGNRTYYAEWTYVADEYEALLAEKEVWQGQVIALMEEKVVLQGKVNTLKDEKKTLEEEIDRLEDRIKELEEEIDRLKDRIKELDDYIKEHEHDYEKGQEAYVSEYEFVTWKILRNDESAVGALTTYDLHYKSSVACGEQIQSFILPEEKRVVSSKQYTYTFVGWSLTLQKDGTPNTLVAFPITRDATDVVYYAQYTCTERVYTITWVIPDIIQNNQLDYDVNATVITETYTYGQNIIVPLAALNELPSINGNYISIGWSSTQGGAKVTNFGKCTGECTFYARYVPQYT
jgi:uncharacterized repeat protein (TIGR02543 family)